MTLSLSDELLAEAQALEALLGGDPDSVVLLDAARLARATRLLRTAADVVQVGVDNRTLA